MDDDILIKVGHGRTRIWRHSLPYEPGAVSPIASRSARVCGPAQIGLRLLAIEAMRPMGFPAYGMIGGRFEPVGGHQFVVELCCPEDGSAFQSSVLERRDGSIRRGLPTEYHGAVLDRVERFCRDMPASPGVLRISCAAHCVVGSSRLAFSGLTKALLTILHAPDSDALPAIVREPWSIA